MNKGTSAKPNKFDVTYKSKAHGKNGSQIQVKKFVSSSMQDTTIGFSVQFKKAIKDPLCVC